MTYCAALLVKDGLVMIADTRTNAGFDDVSIYRKLHVFETPGDRVLALATAGNLSVTQATIGLLHEGVLNPANGEIETLDRAPSLFQAAHLTGLALRRVIADVRPTLQEAGVAYDATLLLGGQIRGGPLRLYMIYGEGNFIECGADSPFLQIGEHKYGKPILDRDLKFDTDLPEALKLGLLSFDSTMRSNLAVAAPLDLIIVKRDAIAVGLTHRVEVHEPYFNDLRERWSAALTAAHQAIPAPPYGAA